MAYMKGIAPVPHSGSGPSASSSPRSSATPWLLGASGLSRTICAYVYVYIYTHIDKEIDNVCVYIIHTYRLDEEMDR